MYMQYKTGVPEPLGQRGQLHRCPNSAGQHGGKSRTFYKNCTAHNFNKAQNYEMPLIKNAHATRYFWLFLKNSMLA